MKNLTPLLTPLFLGHPVDGIFGTTPYNKIAFSRPPYTKNGIFETPIQQDCIFEPPTEKWHFRAPIQKLQLSPSPFLSGITLMDWYRLC